MNASPANAYNLQFNYPTLPGQIEFLQERINRISHNQPHPLSLLGPGDAAAYVQPIVEGFFRPGWQVSPSQVLFASGGHNILLAILLTILKPGAALAVDPITYNNLIGMARLLNVRLVPVAMDAHGMAPEALAEACASAQGIAMAYLMPTLHNPLATVMPLHRREALVEVARRYGLLLVDDDAYGFLVADAPPTLAELAPERSIYFQSLTKPIAHSIKIAVVVAPEALLPKLMEGIRYASHGPSRLFLALLADLVGAGDFHHIVTEKRQEAQVRQAIAREVLGGKFPQATHPSSFHFWQALPPGLDPDAYTAALAEKGVSVVPGSNVAARADQVPSAVRIALGCENSHQRLRAALQIVAQSLN